jgi:hypothetical protein
MKNEESPALSACPRFSLLAIRKFVIHFYEAISHFPPTKFAGPNAA